jgi:transposase-like protein
MGKIRRRFDAAFKKRLLDEIDNGRVTLNQAAEQHHIHATVICRWRRALKEGRLKDRSGGAEKRLSEEVRQYKELAGSLAMEVDWLKKALSAFQHTRSASSSVVTSSNWAQSREDAE